MKEKMLSVNITIEYTHVRMVPIL